MPCPHSEMPGNAARGAVTAELAVALPVVAVVATCAVALAAAAGTRLEAQEAAAVVARAVARGQTHAQARAAGAALSATLRFEVQNENNVVCVVARRTFRVPMVDDIPISARSCALLWGQ